jgi:hypothetical protein
MLPALALELFQEHPALFAQQLEPLVLIAQQLEAVLSELFGPACAPQGAQGGGEGGDAEGAEGEEGKYLHKLVHEHRLLKREGRPAVVS